MAMGALAEASIPGHLRWIPKGMTVRYTAKADSDIRIVAQTPDYIWQEGDVDVTVAGYRADGIAVIEGHITIYVSKKPQRK